MDINANSIKAELQKLTRLPTKVSSWDVETGRDSTNDPAVWVWAMLEEGENVEFDKRSRLRSIIRDRVHKKAGSSLFVYIRFRDADEAEQEQRVFKRTC